jgi:hypothetical protein
MMRWLETVHARSYDDLVQRLPDLIHTLWAAHAPVQEFQSVVTEWLQIHRRACDLYREQRVDEDRCDQSR